MNECEGNPVLEMLEKGYWVTSFTVEDETTWEIDGVVIPPGHPTYPHLLRLPGCAQARAVGVFETSEGVTVTSRRY